MKNLFKRYYVVFVWVAVVGIVFFAASLRYGPVTAAIGTALFTVMGVLLTMIHKLSAILIHRELTGTNF